MGVGISVLIGLKAATLFVLFATLKNYGYPLLSIPCLYASLVSFLVALAANPAINLPILLGKNSDGTFPVWSLVMFSPYLYFVRGFSALRRLKSGEPPYSEISEGLYVGGWPCSPDKLPPGNPAIIDCTCEMPRMLELTGNHAFLCIPTWDTRSPQPADIEVAVKWACRKRAQKIPVFIHCAYAIIAHTGLKFARAYTIMSLLSAVWSSVQEIQKCLKRGQNDVVNLRWSIPIAGIRQELVHSAKVVITLTALENVGYLLAASGASEDMEGVLQ